MIEWGPQVKALEREQERGRTIQALDNRPALLPHLIFIWNCYSMMDSARGWGQGFPQPITVEAMDAVRRIYDLGPSEVDDLIEAVQYLDGAYLARMAQRAKSTK